MRPTRLELCGFTAFRDPVTVDFEGAELFALCGPTGSGKSSLIDAIVFTLYGCVPRLDRRMVAPVISLGRNEARLRLDFTVGGVPYTAVRIVRRTAKGGATTKEARLESADGTVLAGNEKELTAEVSRLLGLDFFHFTTCVVLPQGEFARLLHAEPAKRQDLLVSLLDLGLYERMAKSARTREGGSRQKAEVASTLLNKLAHATPEALAVARARLAEVTSARDEVEAAMPRLVDLDAAARDAAARASEISARAALLTGVVVPAGLADHAEALARARAEVDRTADSEALAAEAVDATEEALRALPRRADLERALEQHARRDTHLQQRAKGQAVVLERRSAEESGAEALAAAEGLAAQAAASLDKTRWDHRAHDLAESLVAGGPCPVCLQTVEQVPVLEPLPAVDQAVASAGKAQKAVVSARSAHSTAQRDLAEVEAKLASIGDQLAELDSALADSPDPDGLAGVLAEVTAAESAERSARDDSSAARRAALAAAAALKHVQEAESLARRKFDELRDRVSSLSPPSPARLDLADDWSELAAWASELAPELLRSSEEAAAAAEAAAAERKALSAALAQRCADVGLEPGARPLHHVLGDAAARVASEVAEIERAIDEAVALGEEVAAHERDAAVARELARLLSANHFEKWVLDEALGMLVEGATGLLHDLSAGAYSLGLDESSSFMVIDHRNADERRSARTLSGGETFLASLALALALADHVGSLASNGAARLESIFLDEGFGTLDPETLDTVATAIEELGSRGRMVGLISHVPELAERVPIRFEVAKTGNSATVTKVVA